MALYVPGFGVTMIPRSLFLVDHVVLASLSIVASAPLALLGPSVVKTLASAGCSPSGSRVGPVGLCGFLPGSLLGSLWLFLAPSLFVEPGEAPPLPGLALAPPPPPPPVGAGVEDRPEES